MALSNNLSAIRGIHVSPGVYSKETVLDYAVKSLGITTLGAVGETVKGPAFQTMHIEDWNQYKDIFGGTDPAKFRGSQYPKYELPYIAKEFLSQSKQLEVVRVLGLSGYNAGPAWVISASEDQNSGSTRTPIVVLRSRGFYEKYPSTDSVNCGCETNKYDKLTYYVGEGTSNDGWKDPSSCTTRSWCSSCVTISEYTNIDGSVVCENATPSSSGAGWKINENNYGKFTINVTAKDGKTYKYPVSLNPYDKDYILKVLGTNNEDGDTLVYVESLYDVVLQNGIENGSLKYIASVSGGTSESPKVSGAVDSFMPKNINEVAVFEPVFDLLKTAEKDLTRANLNKRYLATSSGDTYHSGDTSGATANTVAGGIYYVAQITENNKRKYVYKVATSKSGEDKIEKGKSIVQNLSDGLYYTYTNDKEQRIHAITLDLNDYKSAYRYASTPWIVSNLLGDANSMYVERMFRFHTISDGDAANKEIKVSIENIRTDEGVFDVMIHDINDTDEAPVILEHYLRCSMIPGSNNYVGLKIGTYDGEYEVKSKYVTVEINDTIAAQHASPAGFLGYPSIDFGGYNVMGESGNTNLQQVPVAYNTTYNPDIKNRKQYFGLSSRVGIDIDLFTFKGTDAYIDNQAYMTPGFHLDSRLEKLDEGGTGSSKTGIASISGGSNGTWRFKYVGMANVTTSAPNIPVIDKEALMQQTIYENVNLRKFMVYFAGGFDGWDIYRDQRTNTDDFKVTKYLGSINSKSGKGYNFDRIEDPEAIGLNEKGITSDYYAYLAGARQFANPEAVDCNVFVTPGIDLINNKELSNEVIDMVEQERADSIYVATIPDKPMGNGDYTDEMYSAEDVVALLEDTEIDSNYTCTYYPWVKYFDQENSQYVMLPATKDVVRNMAETDNTAYPWFAPAGMKRGDVNCTKAHIVTKIGDEDVLYDGRINPIKTFAQDGVKVWGQKTLQIADNQLNRIATRRLLLRMRKLISIACRDLVFEPNDPTAKQQLVSTITPIMDNIMNNRGISDYRIEVMDSIESRQRYELPARIFFKAYNQIEYILLDFVLTPEGVSFDNI